MTSKDIKTVELIVNSDQAKAKLEELNKKLDTMKQKREDALNRGDSKALSVYSREVSKLEKEIQRTETRAQGMSKALANLDKSTPNELQRTLRELTRELNSGKIERGSKEWDALTEAIRSTKDALRDVNEEMAVSDNRSFSDKLADWGNKWFGLIENIETFGEALNGIRDTVHSVVNDFATMEEAQAQVRKYTGMSAEEVNSLNESLRGMDTRTSREELNALAGDAGKLGITSKDQILQFVEAADKINVALGDDLGDGAVKNVGKLAMLFEEDARLGLRDAMLATASVVNELSQNSSAGAGYLEEFTARVASVGKQAGLTQAQIMGFAAVLDENMQQDETSATAFSQLITKMYQEPAKFAQLAGQDVKAFSSLLKTDANEALLKFFNAMRSKGGFDQLAPMFAEMGLEGTRATAVLTAVADKLGDVERLQGLANNAYDEAISIQNEFNVQNTTVQAELDKARKAALDMRIELGEKLQPVAAHMVNTTTLFLRALSVTIDFVKNNASAVATLTAMIVAYTVAVKASVIWTKAKTTALLVANNVTKAYHATLKALHAAQILVQIGMAKMQGNWARQSSLMLDLKKYIGGVKTAYGLMAAAVVGVVVAVGTAIKKYIEKRRETQRLREEQERYRKALDAIDEAEKKAQANYQLEKKRIDLLVATVRDSTKSLDERRSAIAKLQSVAPDYHATLTNEGVLTEKNTEAIYNYLVALKKRAIAEALYQKLVASISKQADADMAAASWEKGIKYREGELEKARQKAKETNAYAEEATGGWMAGFQETAVVRVGANMQGQAEIDRNLEILAYDKERLAFWQQKSKDEQAYQNSIFEYAKQKGASAELEQLIANGGNTSVFGNGPSIVTGGAGGAGGAGGSGGSGGGSNGNEDPIKTSIEQLERQALAERLFNEMKFQDGEILHRQYIDNNYKIEEDLLIKKLALYKKESEEYNELQMQLIENQRKWAKQKHDWSLADIDRQEQDEQKAIKDKYLKGEISEEEYQKELLRIRLDYLKKRSDYAKKYGLQDADKYFKNYEDEDYRQKLERQRSYEQKAQAMREEYMKKSIDERQTEEEKLLEELIAAKVIAEEKREEYLKQIRAKYDKERKAEKEEKDQKDGKIKDPLSGNVDGMANDVIQMGKMIDSLQKKIKDGEATWEDYAAVAVASLGFVNSAISAVSQLFQAEQQAQENAITERYDKEISKAGSNSIKGKKLEEQKQKELAAVKNKYRKKQMSMEIAQAVASTAMAAINAYASASKVNFILGPIAAAMALAAGAIQIAAIKKQHSAESSGYYVGGFTGGNSYRKEAGVVHEGEFVANHLAVNNPNVLPMLQFIDYAQKNNTIASVTSADVRRAVGGGGGWADTSRPKAGSSSQVQIIDSSSRDTAEAIKRLNENLEAGIRASVAIDGEDGFERQLKRYNQMKKRK